MSQQRLASSNGRLASRYVMSIDPSQSGYSPIQAYPAARPDDSATVRSPYSRYSTTRSEDEEADAIEDIIMAVSYTDRGLLGCAYYVARSETLFCMEDLKAGDSAIIESLKLYIDPTAVLVPASSPADVLRCLDPHQIIQGAGHNDSDCTHLPYLFEARPSAEFSYQTSKNKLASLELRRSDDPQIDVSDGNDIQQDGRRGQCLRLAAYIDMESKLSIGCAGAILTCLQRRRGTTYLPGDERAHAVYRVAKLEMSTLAETMFITSDTMHALQIMSTESHPNAQQQGPASKASAGGAKEGLSLYGLFYHQAKTPQGRARLRQYFLRPTINLGLLADRIDTIGWLVRPEHSEHLNSVGRHLSKIKNMHLVVEKLQKGANSTGNCRFASSTWASIRHFVYHALHIAEVYQSLEVEEIGVVKKVITEFDQGALAEIGRLINGIIDLEVSQEQHRICVKAGVDSELDGARAVYEGLEDLLSKVAEHFSEAIPSELNAQLNVIFFPQIGFLVSVRLDDLTGSGVYEGMSPEQWDKVFVTETAAYYKNDTTMKLDAEYGDVYGKVCDREIEIIHALTQRVLQHQTLLLRVSDICGELDCMIAMARTAVQYNLVRPHLTDTSIVQITQGRHMLQELTVPAFVANDTNMIDTSMIVMTGPNYSGKSIYLKQVALIVYLAHIGSFVPAEAAIIGVTDKILTRISTRESVSRMSSAFMTDLQQVSIALNLATPRSLLILDEFGKGTESNDGAGLAAGVFEHLLNRQERPRVLAATHYHEIFESGFVAPRAGLEFAHMEVMINDEAAPHQQVTYLYSYHPSRSIQSFGTCCAAMSGISTSIVQRAESLILSIAKSGNLVEICAGMPEQELSELEAAEETARKFLSMDVIDGGKVQVEALL